MASRLARPLCLVVFFTLAACGSSASSSNGPGAPDTPADAGPGTQEPRDAGPPLSDASPSDLDGGTLPACNLPFAQEGSNLQLGTGVTSLPSLAWSGTGYAVAWIDSNANLLLARLTPEGALVGAPSVVATSAYGSAAIAWNGNGWGVAWVKNEPRDASEVDQDVELMVLDANGVPLGAPQTMTIGRDDSIYGEAAVNLAWSGTNYLVTWLAGSFLQLSYSLADASGAIVGQEKALGDTGGNGLQDYGYPSNVVWMGSTFAWAWTAYDPSGTQQNPLMNTWFVRIDGSGNVIGTGEKLTSQPGLGLTTPALSWDGAHAVVTWVQERSFGLSGTNLDFVTLGSDGSEPSQPSTLTTAPDELGATDYGFGPGAIWTGTEMAFVRDVGQGGADGGVTITGQELARYDPHGNPVGTPTPMTVNLPASTPAVVWTGREYAVSWSDGPASSPTLWFARYGACP